MRFISRSELMIKMLIAMCKKVNMRISVHAVVSASRGVRPICVHYILYSWAPLKMPFLRNSGVSTVIESLCMS